VILNFIAKIIFMIIMIILKTKYMKLKKNAIKNKFKNFLSLIIIYKYVIYLFIHLDQPHLVNFSKIF